MFPVQGKRVLVTSSTEGIGRGVAETFASHGAVVTITSRSGEKLHRALHDLRKISPAVYGTQSDMTNLGSLNSLVSYALHVMGGIDILVVNSGNPPREPITFSEADIHDWEYATKLYLLSAVSLSKLVIPDMISRQWGRIFFLSSWTVREPQSILVLADVSRSPLLQLTKILSRDYGRHGITVNTILMGSFPTEGAKKTLSRYAESKGLPFEQVWKERVLDPISVGRLGDVKRDLGSLLLFLSTDMGSYITGTSILVDGGTTSSVG
ncbi:MULTISPECIES: SDR family oxidoreductase [Metallosphaera]|uniref:Short-chain dehydrogenase/reductase SDR n=3 Tax=Metallosphaera TaxID=41980 RepID=A4YHL4_METS5|nr:MULTISPECIES: SDR family oxidoreductase [Metallosphaera]ABP95916.1 short-chain dehydrogenase/reductase SDR [Metallosphaera sedula DSM 5348]AIM27900.1 short-chain dehydrogenase/reductase SDR [Metallosphaera sedula]AKV74737.1 3-oxoacyl-ACP reductase [Metallosphaera sedula]AKV76975.1 3-oxoacyl-ACP reductase [Metallosphaera sedula]AKV79226.1 3-oxoacyl-ACP reductase [Metallosphaera sedula]